MTSFLRVLSFAVAAAAPLAGCATYDMNKAPPAPAQRVSIVYSNAGASGWSDLPIGAYRVPNSQVIVSGHAGGAGAGAAFGLLGVLVADAAATSATHSAVADAQGSLHIDLTAQASALTRAGLASGKFGQGFAMGGAAGGPTLQVNPFIVVTFMNDTEVQPYVILKASLTQPGGAAWSTRYISSVGGQAPLEAFTANGGARLKTALDAELDHAVTAMLDDIGNRRVRDQGKLVYVASAVPYVRFHMALVGPALSDDGKTLVFVPKVADANVFAGVHIVDETVAKVRPATADDKTQMLDEGE